MASTLQQRLGQQGEDRALAYLQQQGLRLLERNFRCKLGELDLIMQHGAALVFVEVRQRTSARYGGAAASVTPAKQRRLLRAAQYFLLRYAELPPCRFDLLAIDGENLSWMQNVLEM